MNFSITATNLPEIRALVESQLKLARINVIEALTRTADRIVAMLAAGTPGGPDGPVASSWTYDPPYLDGTEVKMRIYNSAATEDGKFNIAALLEYGTSPHIILPKNGKALAFPASGSSHADEGPEATSRNYSPVTGEYRPSHASGARYGNVIQSRGEYHRAVAANLKTGKLQFASIKTGKMIRPLGSRDLVVVKEVHHPGTKPQFIVRSRLGSFQMILESNASIALRLIEARTDFREA